MFQLDRKTLLTLFSLLFLITILFAFLYRNYEIAGSSLLILIVLTVFFRGWQATLLAGVLSVIVMTGLVIYFKDDNDILKALFSQVHSLVVIIFAVVGQGYRCGNKHQSHYTQGK